MGMFDYVRCEAPLPDGWHSENLQTKDLGCTMSQVTITKEGRLVGHLREWWWDKHKPERDLDFHGEFTFYDFEGKKPGTRGWKWHEYVARFTEGQLTSIRLSSDSDTHPTGGDADAAPFMGSAGPQDIAHSSPEQSS